MSIKIRMAAVERQLIKKGRRQLKILAEQSEQELDKAIRRLVDRYEAENGSVEPTPISLVGAHIAAMRIGERELSDREVVAMCKRSELWRGRRASTLPGISDDADAGTVDLDPSANAEGDKTVSVKTRLRTLERQAEAQANQLADTIKAIHKAENEECLRHQVAGLDRRYGPIEPAPLHLVGPHIAVALHHDPLSDQEFIAVCKRALQLGEAKTWRIYEA